jgi:hypothetical protein
MMGSRATTNLSIYYVIEIIHYRFQRDNVQLWVVGSGQPIRRSRVNFQVEEIFVS